MDSNIPAHSKILNICEALLWLSINAGQCPTLINTFEFSKPLSAQPRHATPVSGASLEEVTDLHETQRFK